MLSSRSTENIENVSIIAAKKASQPTTSKQTRRPLGDLSNATDKPYHDMEAALRETLAENQQIHQICKSLKEENEELRGKVGELAVVTMLYEAAKAEIEELSKMLENLATGSDNGEPESAEDLKGKNDNKNL